MEKWYTKAKPRLRALGITHQDIADRLKCSQSSVSHKLNGKRDADVDEIMVIAEMIGISIAELVEDDPTFARNQEEKSLIENFRKMSESDRALALKMLKTFTD